MEMMKVISVFLLLSCQVSKNILAAGDSTSLPSHKAEILCLQSKYQDSNICKKWFQSRNQIRSTIVNGTDAPVDEYPWFARALEGAPNNEEFGGWDGCGGMLVAPDWVLTTVRCIYSCCYDELTAFQIGALSNPIRGDNGGQHNEILRIKYTVEHPNFDDSDDLALVKLTQESTITPADMDLSGVVDSFTESKKLWSIGFGESNAGSRDYPDWLQHVELSFVPKQTCMDKYSGFSSFTITDKVMCAGDSIEDPGEEGSCNGDEGGPLYDKQSKKVVGVYTDGWFCGSTGYPGLYVKINDAAKWIKETICSDTTADLDYCEGFTPSTKVWGSLCDSDQDCYQEYKCIESKESGLKRCYWGDESVLSFGFWCSTGDECERGACIDNECAKCSSNDDCPATSSGEGICFENSHCTSGRENEQCLNDEDCLGGCEDELCVKKTEAPSISVSPSVSISSSPSSAPSVSSSPSSFPSSSPSTSAAVEKKSWTLKKVLISAGIWLFIV